MSILDYGKRGAESLGEFTAPPVEKGERELYQLLQRAQPHLKRANRPVETTDGSKKTIEMLYWPLADPTVFNLARELSVFEPMIYGSVNNRPFQGILSANYLPDGSTFSPTLKVIPTREIFRITSSGSPPAEATVMLAGAASAERKGVGGHYGNVAEDLEHKATILGAISINNPKIAISHANHAVRSEGSSTATALSTGRLGNLFQPGSIRGFEGFGTPIVISQAKVNHPDGLYLPAGFMEQPQESFGALLKIDPSRMLLGAGMQALFNRRVNVKDNIQRLAAQVNG